MTQPPIPVVPGEPVRPLSAYMPEPPRRRPDKLSIALSAAGAVALVLAIVVYAAAFARFRGLPAAAPSPSPVVVVSYIPVPSPVMFVPPPSATPPAPATPAVPTIEDGIWTVGLDIPAGRYRVTSAVGGRCYWKISKSGTNGADIIANDIPGGGRPTVTLKAGQDFTSSDCGTWAKI